MNCFNSLTKKEILGEGNNNLQYKVWKPGNLKSKQECAESDYSGELQYKVWEPGDWALYAYDLEVILFLPWESDARASR
jgi:hypothetical protein